MAEKFNKSELRCDDIQKHNSTVELVDHDMPPIDILYDLAELFRIFGDSTRIRILYVLFESEICVCGIAEVLDMTVSAVSHQLRLLKAAGLVKFRRSGKECYYSLADDHVKTIIKMGIEHIEEG